MNESLTEADVQQAAPRTRGLDRWLSAAVAFALIAVVGLGGMFGYEVYADRQRQLMANPATRVIQQLEQEVRQSPNNVILRVRLGEALGAAGRYSAAVEQLNNALKLDPEHPGAYLDLGIIARLTGDNSSAIGYFEKVIEITEKANFTSVDQRRELAYYHLGLVALEEERYEDAVANLKASLRIRKDASDTYYHLARAFEGLGDPDAAIQNLEIAVTFDPGFAEAFYLMGQMYMDLDDPVNASVHFYKAAELAPEADPPAEALASLGTAGEWATKAREALQDSRPDDAVDSVLIANNLAPDNAEYVALHGDILLALGDEAGALKLYEKAVELDPENTEYANKRDELK